MKKESISEKVKIATAYIEDDVKAPLSKKIKKEYNHLVAQIADFNAASRAKATMKGTARTVSVNDLIAYQIGWGKRVIEWYENGIGGIEDFVMPGDGFEKWDYNAIAIHFYKTYLYDGGAEQDAAFNHVVRRIIEIVEKEYQTGNLDKEQVWVWCTLGSGKHWTLSKWITVNTAAPYARASKLIRLERANSLGLNMKH